MYLSYINQEVYTNFETVSGSPEQPLFWIPQNNGFSCSCFRYNLFWGCGHFLVFVLNYSSYIYCFLLAGLLGILVLSSAVIFFFNRYQAFVEVGELYDTQLAQTSRILQGFLNRPADEIDFEHINNALSAAISAASSVRLAATRPASAKKARLSKVAGMP